MRRVSKLTKRIWNSTQSTLLFGVLILAGCDEPDKEANRSTVVYRSHGYCITVLNDAFIRTEILVESLEGSENRAFTIIPESIPDKVVLSIGVKQDWTENADYLSCLKYENSLELYTLPIINEYTDSKCDEFIRKNNSRKYKSYLSSNEDIDIIVDCSQESHIEMNCTMYLKYKDVTVNIGLAEKHISKWRDLQKEIKNILDEKFSMVISKECQ